MPSAANEVVIARPPDVVFAFLADHENDTQWRPGVLDIKRLSDKRWAQGVKGPGGKRIDADIEITESDPPRAHAFQTLTGPVRPRGRYTLTPDGTGTRVRFELEADVGGLKKLMAPMVQKTMTSEVGNLERLKEVLEAR